MKTAKFRLFYCLSCAGVLLASVYPIIMGIRVISDMIKYGTVYAENYPKYIIPYTPISVAVIIGVLIMPLLMRLVKKIAMPVASALSVVVFFLAELLFESQVVVTKTFTTTLGGWQMYMCYISPENYTTRTWTEVDVLMGEYSPLFKVHFYLISVVLIITLLNAFYGFEEMIVSGNMKRKKPLIVQSFMVVAFLGMCILACFTAFYRTGEITVSSLSALLMSVFFVLLGITVGIFVASFFVGKKKRVSIVLPSVIASVITLAMYIGEMFLLSKHLYRFGNGFFFDGLPRIVLAPIDILIILASGALTWLILNLLNSNKDKRIGS